MKSAIAIMGPTAAGKTAVALEIARHVPVEIISVDSALVYRGMDIGTAKPTSEERRAVVHHLIDIIDPAEAYSVAQFRQDTIRLVDEISARGKLPLLVGGTMMYFKALRDGLNDLPAADLQLRAELDAEMARIGCPAMHAKLAAVDPVTAARLKPNDAQRIQRALEIFALTGRPMSQLLDRETNAAAPPFDLLSFALEPSDRRVLHERIALRFDAMLGTEAAPGGLLTEVTALRARGDLQPDLPAMRCVGYRQAWEYLDGMSDFHALREKGIAATRQLAKRQLTWLRAMPDRMVIDCLSAQPAAQILHRLQTVRKV